MFSNLYAYAYAYTRILRLYMPPSNTNDDNYCYELFHDYAFLRHIFSKLQSRVSVVCTEEYKLQE